MFWKSMRWAGTVLVLLLVLAAALLAWQAEETASPEAQPEPSKNFNL